MRKLIAWLRFVFRRKYRPIVVPPTRHDELVSLAEASVKAAEVLGYKLQDAAAEGLLNDASGPALEALHKDLAFRASSLRDELLLEASRQVIPSLRELNA